MTDATHRPSRRNRWLARVVGASVVSAFVLMLAAAAIPGNFVIDLPGNAERVVRGVAIIVAALGGGGTLLLIYNPPRRDWLTAPARLMGLSVVGFIIYLCGDQFDRWEMNYLTWLNPLAFLSSAGFLVGIAWLIRRQYSRRAD